MSELDKLLHEMCCIQANYETAGASEARFLDQQMSACKQKIYELWKRGNPPAASKPDVDAVVAEPFAWAVFCEPGAEFDYLVFANKSEAQSEADGRDDEAEIIPLYRHPDHTALTKDKP